MAIGAVVFQGEAELTVFVGHTQLPREVKISKLRFLLRHDTKISKFRLPAEVMPYENRQFRFSLKNCTGH